MSELILPILLVVAGLYALIKGADYLIQGAADLACWLKVSPMLVGLTVVAFGTSLPEFIVNIFSVLHGTDDLGIGTIVGSNIVNLALGVGVAAIIIPLAIKTKTLVYEFPFLFISNILLLLLANDFYGYQKSSFILDRLDGVILLVIFGFFMYYIFRSMKEDKQKLTVEKQQNKNSIRKNVLLIVGGLVALVGGGEIFVRSATNIATLLKVSEAFIGLTVAAIGTSLPEIFTTIIAAIKKQSDLAIGNIMGSNIFNILFVLGFTSFISPINVSQSILAFDGMVLLGMVLMFLLFATSQKKITRWEGATIVAYYAVYFGFLMWRL